MNFATAVKTCLFKFKEFDGRASRSEFWWFILFYELLCLTAVIVDSLLYDENNMEVFYLLVLLVLSMPVLSVSVRRLHDIGQSGWFVIPQLVVLVSEIGFQLVTAFDPQATTDAFALGNRRTQIMFFANLLSVYLIAVFVGMKGVNAYGPDPLEVVKPAAKERRETRTENGSGVRTAIVYSLILICAVALFVFAVMGAHQYFNIATDINTIFRAAIPVVILSATIFAVVSKN